MIDGAGSIEADHAEDKYSQSQKMELSGFPGALKQKGSSCCHGKNHSDKVSDGAAGVFDFCYIMF